MDLAIEESAKWKEQTLDDDRFVLSLGPEATYFHTLIIHNSSQSRTEHRPKSAERTDHSPKTYRHSPIPLIHTDSAWIDYTSIILSSSPRYTSAS